MTGTWTKTYPTAEAAATAALHYQWIRDVGHLTVPDLLRRNDRRLVFEHIDGRHVAPADLPAIAGVLARFHIAAHEHLGGRRAGQAHHVSDALIIPAFDHRRRQRIVELLAESAQRPRLTSSQAEAWIDRATHLPAAVYKDANVRNFLITETGSVAVDFDTLTLAPLGYDLAKLVVSATMTYGPLRGSLIARAVSVYNAALSTADLPACTTEEFAAWTAIHHLLTSPYQGLNGYRYF